MEKENIEVGRGHVSAEEEMVLQGKHSAGLDIKERKVTRGIMRKKG